MPNGSKPKIANMKCASFLSLFLSFYTINAVFCLNIEEEVTIYGDVHGKCYTKIPCYARVSNESKIATYELTYPKVPLKQRIIGIHFRDLYPRTELEFTKGKIGDRQITIKLTAIDHDIEAHLVFYVNRNETADSMGAKMEINIIAILTLAVGIMTPRLHH